MDFIIGVDEAGRGPLAGPVSVGVFLAPQNFKNKLIKILGGKIKDSKKLTPTKREAVYSLLLQIKNGSTKLTQDKDKINFFVSHISNKVIDKVGISKAVQKGINLSLKKLDHTSNNNGSHCWYVRLDGLLKAPKEFENQKTIIKGDEKDVFIACASIVAKVERDRLMTKLSKKYPEYGFDIHKGYGTLQHRNLVKKLGGSPIHRKSFCKNIGL